MAKAQEKNKPQPEAQEAKGPEPLSVVSIEETPGDPDKVVMSWVDAGGAVHAGTVRASILRKQIQSLEGYQVQGDKKATARAQDHLALLKVQLASFPEEAQKDQKKGRFNPRRRPKADLEVEPD